MKASGDSMLITSLNNEQVKELVRLKDKKYRDKVGLFFAEGEDLLNEAYKAGLLKHIYVVDGYDNPYEGMDITYVTIDVMKKISDMDSPSNYYGVCEKKKEKMLGDRIVVLDDIQDPGNLGTIIRSAVAFNFDTVVLGSGSVDIYNPKVVRSSKGMLFNINIISRNLVNFLGELKDYQIYGTDVNEGIDIKNEKIDGNVAVIIGNEGKGISEEVKEYCNKFIYIDMNKNCESLNAGVSASIIMYEVNNK